MGYYNVTTARRVRASSKRGMWEVSVSALAKQIKVGQRVGRGGSLICDGYHGGGNLKTGIGGRARRKEG